MVHANKCSKLSRHLPTSTPTTPLSSMCAQASPHPKKRSRKESEWEEGFTFSILIPDVPRIFCVQSSHPGPHPGNKAATHCPLQWITWHAKRGQSGSQGWLWWVQIRCVYSGMWGAGPGKCIGMLEVQEPGCACSGMLGFRIWGAYAEGFWGCRTRAMHVVGCGVQNPGMYAAGCWGHRIQAVYAAGCWVCAGSGVCL